MLTLINWQCFLIVDGPKEKAKGFLGSGSLITGKAVITAGHNICTDVNPPKYVSRQGLCALAWAQNLKAPDW